jgi:hypothetical protein
MSVVFVGESRSVCVAPPTLSIRTSTSVDVADKPSIAMVCPVSPPSRLIVRRSVRPRRGTSRAKGISDGGGAHFGARADKCVCDMPGVAVHSPPAPCCAQKDQMECEPVLGPEPFRVGCQEGCELLVARIHGSRVLCKEFHLLPHAAASDNIIAVEAGRPAFAVENLVADVVFDEELQLPLGRRQVRAKPSAVSRCLQVGGVGDCASSYNL